MMLRKKSRQMMNQSKINQKWMSISNKPLWFATNIAKWVTRCHDEYFFSHISNNRRIVLRRECKLNCVSRSAYGSCFAVQFFCCKIKYNDWEVILLAKSKRDQKSAELAKQILENYQPET